MVWSFFPERITRAVSILTTMSLMGRALRRHHVGALPLIHRIAARMGLRALLDAAIQAHGNDQVPVVDTLMLLIYNLALGKDPLYELAEWVESIDRRVIGYQALEPERFSDDRFARSLDRLYQADRASLMTELVLAFSRAFNVDLSRIHNDSTTVKAYGAYPGKTGTGFELKQGHSKDHRPDLKQLLFSLSLSADGAVPVHHKVYAGNCTDDKTHIETWNTLCRITPDPHFLYVADSKLCTDEQLHYIVRHGGRTITIMPESWAEVTAFKSHLRAGRRPKREIWRRPRPEAEHEIEYFSVFNGEHFTRKRGYRIHWIYSSAKRRRDRLAREKRLAKSEQALLELNTKLNRRHLKDKEAIEAAATALVRQHQMSEFIAFEVNTALETYQVQLSKGRPGKHTRYESRERSIYILSWRRRSSALKAEARVDGVFPLLSTDASLSAKSVLQAYKYQPRIEKRFSQFKSIHNAAPLLFKKVHRVEANMLLFFIALVIQSLIEREVRNRMDDEGQSGLAIYPEDRDAPRPTTSKIFDRFERLSTYSLMENGHVVEEFKDELTDTQKIILRYLGIDESNVWSSI
jgi:transposase